MPDALDPQTQSTPGQVLAGSPPPQQAPQQQTPPPPQVQDAPLNSRQGPGLSPSGFPQQQPRPTPQQAVDQHHTALGKVTGFLFGRELDPDTGQPVKQSPGSIFRSLLAGALLGASAGLKEGHGALGGLAAGGVAGMQMRDQQAQQAQAQADRRKNMSMEEQKAADEHQLHQANVAHLTVQTTAFHHLQDLHDQEALDAKNKAARAYMKTLEDAGARPAQIPVYGKIPANGLYNASDVVDAINRDPSILFGAPGTVRHFVDEHSDGDMDYVQGKGWVNANGDPVNVTKNTTIKAFDVPENLYKTPLHHSGKELNAIAGYQLIPKTQEDHEFIVPLDAVTNLYSQNLKNLNAKAQADQREGAANKSNTAAKKSGSPKPATQAQFDGAVVRKSKAIATAQAVYDKSIGNDSDLAKLKKAQAAAQATYEEEIRTLKGTQAKPAGQAGGKPKVGDSVTLKDGRTVTVTGINADGKGFTHN
jgi:hypothetical protein